MNVSFELPPLDHGAIAKLKEMARAHFAEHETCGICGGRKGLAWGHMPDDFETHFELNRRCFFLRQTAWAKMHGWRPVAKSVWLNAIGETAAVSAPVSSMRDLPREDPQYGTLFERVWIPGWVADLIEEYEKGIIHNEISRAELLRAIGAGKP